MSDKPKFTDRDWDDFVNFIAEKSRNVTAPFSLRELCKEYKMESGTTHSENLLLMKLREFRLRIHNSKYFDTDTKVKMLFGLKAPVDYSFLAELEKEADVEIDQYNRITKYEKKEEGGFQLNGVPNSQAPWFPCDTVRKMLKFLSVISQNRKTPIEYDEFAKEFESSTDYKLHKNQIKNYEYIKFYLHMAMEYDVPTRIKMFFVSAAKVNSFFLEMLRKDAIVDVDDEGKISKYEAHDGSLILNIDQNSTEKNKVEQQDENKKSSEAQVESEKKKDEETLIIDDSVAKSSSDSVSPSKIDNEEDSTLPKTSSDVAEVTPQMKNQNSTEESKVEKQNNNKKPSKTQVASEGKTKKKESTSHDLSKERVKNNVINKQIAVVKPTKPVKKQDDVEVKTNSSVRRSGRVSKKIYPTADFFNNHGDDQFVEKRKKYSKRQHSKNKKSDAVFDGSSPKTPLNNINIGGDVSDDDDEVKVSKKKKNVKNDTSTPTIPVKASHVVPISDPCSSTKKDDDVEFDAPTNEDNKAKTSESTNVSKNGDSSDAKKSTKSVASTLKINKIPAEKPVVSAISKAGNGGKSNIKKVTEPIKTMSIPNINKRSKIMQREKNVVKTTPKVENKKRKVVFSSFESSAAKITKNTEKSISATSKKQENEESQEDLIYVGGDPPLPIPLKSRKTEEIIDYQEEQIDRFVAYKLTEFGNSQFLPDYPHENGVNLEEMDALETIRDASFSPINLSFPVENQRIEMTNSEDILKMLRSLVRFLDAPMIKLRESSKKNLQEFLEKINKAIDKMRVEDHKVAIDEISPVLNTSLQIVIKSAPSTSSSEDCASLQSFLWTLRTILITLSIPALDEFEKTINENIKELDGQDKMIPIERIRRSLETVFALATS